MKPSIFVSYRQEDSAVEAGRIQTTLASAFCADAMFMGASSCQPDADWRSVIGPCLESASAVVVVIGPEWLHVNDEWGERRIDQDDDRVRTELEQVLIANKEIIPALVRGVRRPPPAKVPESIDGVIGRPPV